MTSNLTKDVAKVLAKLKTTTPTRSKKRRNRNRRNTGRSRGPDGILAGYGSPITTVFSSRNTNDGLIVRGYDLVTSFSFGDNISYFITANPAAWNGTRIAAIAGGFQNYRPLKFRIHYRPQVGSTDLRSMFIGTIWQTNYITERSAIEPSLLTSPGGVYLPAWNDSVTNVNLRTCLPQRMFPIRDPHFTTVPFSVIARSSTGGPDSRASTMPGRIFIEYTYEFRNAIGSGTGFMPSEVTMVEITTLSSSSVMCAVLNNAYSGVSNSILVDIRPTSGDIDRVQATPSELLPLGGQFTYDISESSAESATAPIKINGHYVFKDVFQNLYQTTSMILFLYHDGGVP